MKNKKLKGAILGISGGSMALMMSGRNILELPVLLFVIVSLLISIVGVIIVIRNDRKNINYYLLIFALAVLFLALPFIKQ